MGKDDLVSKKYIGRPDVFADIVNFCIYKGEQVIKPENLNERDPSELSGIEHKEST